MCSPALMFFSNYRLVSNSFVSTWRDNIRWSRSVGIFFRPLFAHWFNVDCVIFHWVKARFIILCDTLVNLATSVTFCSFERTQPIIPFCQLVTFLLWHFYILQHTKWQQTLNRSTIINNLQYVFLDPLIIFWSVSYSAIIYLLKT